MDDGQIIELYWARSEKAIEETAARYSRYCHSIAMGILHNQQDAEECVNDTYLRAWDAIPPQRPRHLAAFLGRITRNLALDLYQRYSAKKRGMGQAALALSELNDCIPSPGNVEQEVSEQALTRSIEQFLFASPKLKRDVFILRYWHLMPIREIAKTYGISQSKTASMLHRTRQQLKTHLMEEGVL